jgi:hypothetical protein
VLEALELVENDEVRLESVQAACGEQPAKLSDYPRPIVPVAVWETLSGPAKAPAEILEAGLDVGVSLFPLAIYAPLQGLRELGGKRVVTNRPVEVLYRAPKIVLLSVALEHVQRSHLPSKVPILAQQPVQQYPLINGAKGVAELERGARRKGDEVQPIAL